MLVYKKTPFSRKDNPIKYSKLIIYKSLEKRTAKKGLFDFTITFDDFLEVWGDKWELKGGTSLDLMLTRIDLSDGWHKHNITLKTVHNNRLDVTAYEALRPKARKGTVILTLKELIKQTEKNNGNN